jgi:hypothetical protein
MGGAIGQILASAVGIALSPLPLIAAVLLLATPRGLANGLAFAASWALALAVVVTVVLVSASGGRAASAGDTPATWALWVKLSFGVLFLALAVSEWRRRPAEGESARPPGWVWDIERFTPAEAAGLAGTLAMVNPKNLILALGGGLAIAGSGASLGGQVAAAAVMVLISSLCALLPLAVYLVAAERSTDMLAGWKTWMSAHSGAIVLTGLVILSAKYIGEAVSQLTT